MTTRKPTAVWAMGFAAALAATATAQDRTITVPNAVLQPIVDVLPERSNAGAAFLNREFQATLTVTGTTEVSITFVHEGAGFRNSMGYFTFQNEPDGSVTILTRGLLIQDASLPPQGSLQPGDTWDLRDENGDVVTFEAGDQIGFFVVANGWNSDSRIRNWDPTTVNIPASTASANRFIGYGCYTSIPEINPEVHYRAAGLSQHTAMIAMDAVAGFNDDEPFLVCGFEDLNRKWGSDDDFNDLIFIINADPISNIDLGELWSYAPGDTDADGVPDVDDFYPDDATRSTLVRIPDGGNRTLGFEDLYPVLGDADYNDVVVAYHYEMIKDSDGRVVDLLGEYSLIGRGAALDHEFGVRIEGIPGGATGTVSIERFLSDDNSTTEVITDADLVTYITDDRRFSIFPSTMAALPPLVDGDFTNVRGSVERESANARLRIHFDTPVDERDLGSVPFDPYLRFLRYGLLADTHLPGKDGFADRHNWFPTETGATSFLDDDGYPWVIDVPSEWRFPLERKRIWQGYAEFNPWVSGGGVDSRSWFDTPRTTGGWVSPTLEDVIVEPDWTLDIPR